MDSQNNWRHQLRNREINPKDETWLAIEAGLNHQKNNRFLLKSIILLIAAVAVGVIVMVSLPTTSSTSQDPVQYVQEEPSKENQTPEVIHQVEEVSLSISEEQSLLPKDDSSSMIEISVQPEKYATEVVENETVADTLPAEEEHNLHQKATALLAEVEKDLQQEKKAVYSPDAEVETLLAEAKVLIEEVEYDKLYEFAKASQLLADVEEDISKDTLQNRVWKFVKSNFQNIENALVSLR